MAVSQSQEAWLAIAAIVLGAFLFGLGRWMLLESFVR